jgi:peptidoglycan/xylan/chitin deacetylase (PgdA/CDA1 family)
VPTATPAAVAPVAPAASPTPTATESRPPTPTSTPVPPARTLKLPPPGQAGEISTGNPASNKIALTFDAGIPSPNIPIILDHLKNAGVKSTMFLTGKWAEGHPEYMARMAAEGHEMGNHSFSHPDFPTISNSAMVDEVNRAETSIQRLSGKAAKPWFRFPSGARDARTNRVVADLGYYSIYWSLDSLDWEEDVSPAQVMQRTTSMAKSGDIIVMHLTSPQTAQVLPEVISRLRARGFELVLVSELLSE